MSLVTKWKPWIFPIYFHFIFFSLKVFYKSNIFIYHRYEKRRIVDLVSEKMIIMLMLKCWLWCCFPIAVVFNYFKWFWLDCCYSKLKDNQNTCPYTIIFYGHLSSPFYLLYILFSLFSLLLFYLINHIYLILISHISNYLYLMCIRLQLIYFIIFFLYFNFFARINISLYYRLQKNKCLFVKGCWIWRCFFI